MTTSLKDTPQAVLSNDGVTNHRILVVDDNESIHADFDKILLKRQDTSSGYSEAEASLFGDSPTGAEALADFELVHALGGEQAAEILAGAVKAGDPPAVAFVDMRMPNGWDGLETIQKLWEIDPELQIVICTAFSDHSWSDIVARIGYSESLLVLKKPFDAVEVVQMATALCQKWTHARNANLTFAELERRVDSQTRDVRVARDLALHVINRLRLAWSDNDELEGKRCITRLESGIGDQATDAKGEHAIDRSAARTKYLSQSTVYIPNPMLTRDPLFRVMCRNISQSGMSFLYHKEIMESELIVFLEMRGRPPIICFADIVRCRVVGQQMWEYGVKFRDKDQS